MSSRRPLPPSRRLTLVIGASVVALIALVAAALTGSASPHRAAAPTRERATTGPAARTTTTTRPRVVASSSTLAVPTTTRATVPVTTSPTTRAPSTTVATVPPPASPIGSGSLASVAGKTIMLDPGHDGGNASHPAEINRPVFIGTETKACNTVGTETDDGYPEHAYTFDVALRLRALLTAAGAHVVMTRTNDTGVGPCIDQRAAIGNNAHAAVGIAIHADGGPASGRGSCVYMPALTPGYTDDIYAASHRFGVDLRDAYAAESGIPVANYVCSDGLTEANDYGGLNLSNIPVVLFETANMRNATDAAYIEQPSGRQRVAMGIALGIARFLAD